MIAVDTKVLAKALGLEEWPEEFHNDSERMAARCVTDFLAPYNGRHVPEIAIKNALAWIDRAYEAGRSAGIALERRTWQEKLASMFDIPVVR